jgi:hypothetical protein
VRLFLDGREQPRPPQSPVHRLAVTSGSTPLTIGHVALTRTVPALADRAAPRPVPGRFWASGGDWPVFAQEAGTYVVYVGAAPVDTVELAQGPGHLTLRAGDAPVVVTLARPADGTTASVRGESIAGHGKRLLDPAVWAEVTLDATVSVRFDDGASHADLLLRASQLAEGGEGTDTVLGIDFLLGYSVQLHRDRVVLARHAYDEQVLASHPAPIDSAPHRLRVRARGDAISVELDGRGLFEVHDPLPYPAGAIGIRTSNARLHVERLELAAGGQPTT